MRVWRYQGTHRLAWVVLALLVLAVAIFVMAAGFGRLRGEAAPAGADPLETGVRQWPSVRAAATPWGSHGAVADEREAFPTPA